MGEGVFQGDKYIHHSPLHHPTFIREKEMDLPMEIEIKFGFNNPLAIRGILINQN